MIFAAILAGGVGARMGNPDKPKQFYMLGDKPILIHTVEKFCVQGSFEKVIVLCPETWVSQTKDLVKRYAYQYEDEIEVIPGGQVRNETIMNALAYIQSVHTLDEQTIIVTHDAVRPFVSYRIIEENIKAAQKSGACDTVVAATDTIVESLDGEAIASIPPRNTLYQGQTPQSFQALKLKQLMESLNDEEKAILTDACKIFVLRDEKVALVRGDVSNIKITYPHDMRVARAMLEDCNA